MNRVVRRARSAAALAALCFVPAVAPAPLRPQSPAPPTEVSVPPNLILPNYERIPVGQREGIEGNAFVARTGDAGASWYNPAGLARSEKSVINASATAYEWTRVELEGLGASTGRAGLHTIATLLAGVIGAPVIDSPRWRLGFSVTRPVSWQPSGIDFRFPVSDARGSLAVGYTTDVDFYTLIGGVAAGFTPSGRRSGGWRFGAGLGVPYTALSQTQAITGRLTTSSDASVVETYFSSEGSVWHLQLVGGAQWEDSSRGVTVGARLVAPGIRLFGGSRLSFHETRTSGAGFSDLSFSVRDARFDYKLPLEVDAGVALRHARGAVELDVHHHGAASEYEIYGTDAVAELVQLIGGTPPVTSTVPFRDVVASARAVTNVLAGGSYAVSRGFRLHAGVLTDRSPVGDPERSIFRKVDLTRVTAGASVAWVGLSGSLGFGYSFGDEDARTISVAEIGDRSRARLRVRSVNLVYAFSYAF